MVDVAGADVVAILTRAPSSGGKTRLFQALSRPPDETLLAALLLDTIDSASSPGVSLIVCVTPAAACGAVARLRPALQVIAQPDGTLGERMRATMELLFESGARRVALIGSDLPAVEAADITSAFSALTRDPASVVIGPAVDGGYYLLAATRVPPLFDGMAWGTSSVLADTLASAARAGITVQTVATRSDVDSVADLLQVRATVPRSRTAAWARAHLPD